MTDTESDSTGTESESETPTPLPDVGTFKRFVAKFCRWRFTDDQKQVLRDFDICNGTF